MCILGLPFYYVALFNSRREYVLAKDYTEIRVANLIVLKTWLQRSINSGKNTKFVFQNSLLPSGFFLEGPNMKNMFSVVPHCPLSSY